MKYIELYRTLKQAIHSGGYKGEGRLPYIKELMAQYNVSVTTVQKAVGLLKKEGLVISVPSQGLFIRGESHPSPATSWKPVRIGVIIQQYLSLAFAGPYFSQIFVGIERTILQKNGSAFPFSARNRDIFDVSHFITAFNINALITVDIGPGSLNKDLESLGLPIVHADMPDTSGTKPILTANHMEGGQIAFKKLMDLGHRNILYIDAFIPGTTIADTTSELRWSGIVQAAREMHAPAPAHATVSVTPKRERANLLKALDANTGYTGYIVNGLILFQALKSILESRSPARVRNYDIVLFEQLDSPAFIYKKNIYFCKWDAFGMGKSAVQYFFDQDGKLPRVQIFPMTISTNIV